MARPNEGKKLNHTCLACATSFDSYLRSGKRASYCSRQCYRIGCQNQDAEVIRIRVLANTGQRRTPEQRMNMSLAVKRDLVEMERRRRRWLGELNPLWQGGKRKEYIHLNDSAYKHWRSAVFQRDNWTCQDCSIRGNYITAHHIKSWVKFPELRYELSNGITLCENCHSLTDNYKGRGQQERCVRLNC